MVQEIAKTSEALDPRIVRSRLMLMNALSVLLKKKLFEEISVQDITEQATLNRNTFYLHYPDKIALLQAMTESRFRALIARRNISFVNCNGALRAIALGVCDYLVEVTNCPEKGAQLPLEGAIVPAIETMFMEGVSHHAVVPGIDPAMMANAAAWAVFGAARRWHQAPARKRIPAEEMAAKIETMVKPVFLNSFV